MYYHGLCRDHEARVQPNHRKPQGHGWGYDWGQKGHHVVHSLLITKKEFIQKYVLRMYTYENGPNGLNCQCCLAASSKTAPTILIFSIAMGADYSFELISSVHWVPAFFMNNKSILGRVTCLTQTIFQQRRKKLPKAGWAGSNAAVFPSPPPSSIEAAVVRPQQRLSYIFESRIN